ncbi:Uncharacterized protein Fot_20719 [Forsythia ovata]|uniref:Uncharacterized protein n=1 Tax=Forsythia ovata TaxID=205694 RepID=A0ABD1USS5_9LAMI
MKRKGRRRQEYCKDNNSAVEYPLGLKLIVLHIEDVSFATDQTEHHLEVENIGYENYDSSAKRRLLVSFGIFLCIYYKGGMLGEQSASLLHASAPQERAKVLVRVWELFGRCWLSGPSLGTRMRPEVTERVLLYPRVTLRIRCGATQHSWVNIARCRCCWSEYAMKALANMPVRRDEHDDCVVGYANDPQCFGRS